ncbi:MAG: hypothetical protein IAC87_00940 [Muribaculum sp.]|uniref:Uncharacterized protein n=1 Tax=Candidatus Merdivivens faecigallinarum TaxID=2840871 RepID=A0A9D9IY37_9BACT|nr:hypothetical protein [Candidatus Merdivivens faecigallinarum]
MVPHRNRKGRQGNRTQDFTGRDNPIADFRACPDFLRGKVNHFATNLWHFPHGKSDYQHFIHILLGKVNRISTNSRHFPL